MSEAIFRFLSEAAGGDQFTVIGFSGSEAISSLYRYEIEIKAPLSAAINLDDVLDSPARFVTELNGQEYPVHGILSSFDELQSVQGFVHYQAVLVPRLWSLSTYKTNEIYSQEKSIDVIIQAVLENAGFSGDADFDLGGLDKSRFLQRDYLCQFGESDFDFISRLMEREGIFYYFEHSGPLEKVIFVNDMNYLEIPRPGLIFDVAAQTSRQHDCIDAWSCRKQRLPAAVTVRDFNPDQPSLDISDTAPVDNMGQGTEYIYGDNVNDVEEAIYLSEIRAEEQLCSKTRYYGESAITRLQAGYLFALDLHPNTNYNGVEYLTVEVNHQGQHLDMDVSGGPPNSTGSRPQYRNSFVVIDASLQYRPPRKTPKPRFFGTMTAFIHAESGTMNAEIDQQGRYRVHLPFDRADGTMESTDPDRKASTWIRMAQPYVGQDQGMYFPLAGGTEVLLTFINGDPDQPVISGALPNAAQPSLLTSDMNLQRTITAQVSQTVSGNTHTISQNSAAIALLQNPPPAPDPTAQGREFINQGETQATAVSSMLPPWSIPDDDPDYDAANPNDAKFIKFYKYDEDFKADPMKTAHLSSVSTERNGGDRYGYANTRTFAYPQHERVYFIGTFHEDFHVKDDFITAKVDGTYNSWTGNREQFNFPEPGGMFPENTHPVTDSDAVVNPDGIRGVSEDKRWGDQMNYAWGRSFNWAGGPAMNKVDENGAIVEASAGYSFAVYNYGNGYTENLITEVDGTSDTIPEFTNHEDIWDYSTGWTPSKPLNFAKLLAPIVIGIRGITSVIAAPFTGGASLIGLIPTAIQGGLSGRGMVKSFLANTQTLDPDKTAVEKTFGNTYSYQNGLAVDIHEGNTISRTYGDTDDWVKGNSESVTEGDSVATTVGMCSEAYLGNKYEFNFSTVDALTIGMSTEFVLGGKHETFIGLESTINLSGGIDVNFGYVQDFCPIALKIEAVAAKKSEAELATKLAVIDDVKATIRKAAVNLNDAAIDLENTNLALASSKLNMIG